MPTSGRERRHCSREPFAAPGPRAALEMLCSSTLVSICGGGAAEAAGKGVMHGSGSPPLFHRASDCLCLCALAYLGCCKSVRRLRRPGAAVGRACDCLSRPGSPQASSRHAVELMPRANAAAAAVYRLCVRVRGAARSRQMQRPRGANRCPRPLLTARGHRDQLLRWQAAADRSPC